MIIDPLAARIEVSRSALLHNVAQLRAHLAPGQRLAAVLKGNAYGHGRDLVASVVADHVDLLATADPIDALALADAAPDRVLSLAPPHGDVLRECVSRGVQVTVSRRSQVSALEPGARVHLLVDSGLHRLGAAPEDVTALAQEIRATGATIEAVYCMVARADFEEWDAVKREIALLRSLPLGPVQYHFGGSSLLLERPDLAGDIGRTGLALLGHHPRAKQRDLIDLMPSMRLFAPILELRTVAAGSHVGYQARQVHRDTTIATVALGSGHGLPLADGRGMALVDDVACSFLCPPSLDYALLDVTDVPGATVGTDALLLGGGPTTPTSAEETARRSGLLLDHVLVGWAQQIPRVLTA